MVALKQSETQTFRGSFTGGMSHQNAVSQVAYPITNALSYVACPIMKDIYLTPHFHQTLEININTYWLLQSYHHVMFQTVFPRRHLCIHFNK